MLFGGISVFIETSNSLQITPALQLPFEYVYLALPVGFGFVYSGLFKNIFC